MPRPPRPKKRPQYHNKSQVDEIWTYIEYQEKVEVNLRTSCEILKKKLEVCEARRWEAEEKVGELLEKGGK